MGDVTRPAPGSLGCGANESAVGGRRRGAREEVQECAASRAAWAGGRHRRLRLRLRPAPPLPGLPEWSGRHPRAPCASRLVCGSAALALPSAHGRAPCRDSRELGLAALGSIGFPLVGTGPLKKKGKPNKTCPCR